MYITNENYHKSLKYSNYISSSQIKQASVSGRNTLIKFKEKAAFNLGTAFHTAILEPNRIEKDLILEPIINKRTKIGKLEYEKFLKKAKNKTIINDNQAKTLEEMIDSVYSHKIAVKLLKMEGNKPEYSVFLKDKTFNKLLKMRADILNIDKKIIIDLKCCQNSKPEKFIWQAKRFKYDLQAYHYLRCANQKFGSGFIFLFICTENVEPFNTTIFRASEKFLKSGEIKWAKGFETLKNNDTISHYSDDIETL